MYSLVSVWEFQTLGMTEAKAKYFYGTVLCSAGTGTGHVEESVVAKATESRIILLLLAVCVCAITDAAEVRALLNDTSFYYAYWSDNTLGDYFLPQGVTS